eukprot:4401209-Alexandrium_andersonii.AAC.1
MGGRSQAFRGGCQAHHQAELQGPGGLAEGLPQDHAARGGLDPLQGAAVGSGERGPALPLVQGAHRHGAAQDVD